MAVVTTAAWVALSVAAVLAVVAAVLDWLAERAEAEHWFDDP